MALGGTAWAGTKCYNFSGPAVGTTYHLGQTVNARHSTIHLKKFHTTNGPSQSQVQAAEIINSNLPQGGAPSLKLTSIVAQVVPEKKLRTVKLKYAENTGQSGRHDLNFGVNDHKRVWRGTLGQLDGKVMGDPNHGGRVRVSVSADPLAGGYWIRGVMTLRALNGLLPRKGIEDFELGGASQVFLDDVCVTW